MLVTSFSPTLAVARSSGPQAYCHGEAEGRGPVPHDLRAPLEAAGGSGQGRCADSGEPPGGAPHIAATTARSLSGRLSDSGRPDPLLYRGGTDAHQTKRLFLDRRASRPEQSEEKAQPWRRRLKQRRAEQGELRGGLPARPTLREVPNRPFSTQ